jgi:hypothetical protein
MYEISEDRENNIFIIENDYEKIEIKIPAEFNNLTPNQLWLLEHQITVLWHCLGFSHTKGLIIPKEVINDYKFGKEKTAKHIIVNHDWLDNKLIEMISNFARYKLTWNEDFDHDVYPKNFNDFLKRENTHWGSRRDLLLFVLLLQNFVNIKVEYHDKRINQIAN